MPATPCLVANRFSSLGEQDAEAGVESLGTTPGPLPPPLSSSPALKEMFALQSSFLRLPVRLPPPPGDMKRLPSNGPLICPPPYPRLTPSCPVALVRLFLRLGPQGGDAWEDVCDGAQAVLLCKLLRSGGEDVPQVRAPAPMPHLGTDLVAGPRRRGRQGEAGGGGGGCSPRPSLLTVLRRWLLRLVKRDLDDAFPAHHERPSEDSLSRPESRRTPMDRFRRPAWVSDGKRGGMCPFAPRPAPCTPIRHQDIAKCNKGNSAIFIPNVIVVQDKSGKVSDRSAGWLFRRVAIPCRADPRGGSLLACPGHRPPGRFGGGALGPGVESESQSPDAMPP